MNKVILVGRLTADPVLRQTPSGVSSCSFTIAVNRRFVDKNTGERQTDFIRCNSWRQTAEFISRYFKKGSMICVEGSLRSGSYTDKNHPDVTHYTQDVLVDNAEFTGSKAETGTGGSGGYSSPYSNPGGNAQNPPQQTMQPAADNDSMSYGNLNDFEEILSDGNVPF